MKSSRRVSIQKAKAPKDLAALFREWQELRTQVSEAELAAARREATDVEKVVEGRSRSIVFRCLANARSSPLCLRSLDIAAEEDFGIAPIEAQACATPVIAFGWSGTTKTVINGKTDLFLPNSHSGKGRKKPSS